MERKKSIHVWLYTILIVGIIAAVIWGATATKNAKALEVTTENQYNRAFHELVGYVDDIDTLLSKTQLTKSPAQLAKLSSDIFRQSAGAFTAVSDGQINVPIDENSTVYKACNDALNGWDPSGGAIYYFNPDTATNAWIWSRPLIKTIGKHRFCK